MQRYDVIVYEIATNKVTNILGRNLRQHGSFNSADSRLAIVLTRLNGSYDAEIVPTGTYKEGEIRS